MSSDITFTSKAAQRIAIIKNAQNKPEAFFRIGIKGGGCSGFEYVMDLDDVLEEDDHVFETEGERLVIDDVSLGLMKGSTIDFVNDLVGSKFEIKNPMADAACGCGSSFAIKS